MELPLTLTADLPHPHRQGETADDGVKVPKLYHLSHSCMANLRDAEAPASQQAPDIPSTKACSRSDPRRPQLPVSQTRPGGTCPEDATRPDPSWEAGTTVTVPAAPALSMVPLLVSRAASPQGKVRPLRKPGLQGGASAHSSAVQQNEPRARHPLSESSSPPQQEQVTAGKALEPHSAPGDACLHPPALQPFSPAGECPKPLGAAGVHSKLRTPSLCCLQNSGPGLPWWCSG